MIPVKLITAAVTTDASGDFEIALTGALGRFLQYRYVPDATSALDTGADIDLVGDVTGIVLLNHDDIGTSAFTKAARQPTSDAAGAASLYAAAGEPVEDYIWVNGENLTFTVANGGNVLSGVFYFWFG